MQVTDEGRDFVALAERHQRFRQLDLGLDQARTVDRFFVQGERGDRLTQHLFGLGMFALRGLGAPEHELRPAGIENVGRVRIQHQLERGLRPGLCLAGAIQPEQGFHERHLRSGENVAFGFVGRRRRIDKGLDFARVLGAIRDNVIGGFGSTGGSTITMQLARNLFPQQLPPGEKSIRRKLAEVKLAL